MFLLLLLLFIASPMVIGSDASDESSSSDSTDILNNSIVLLAVKNEIKNLEGKSSMNLLEKCEKIYDLCDSCINNNNNDLSELQRETLYGYAIKKGENFVETVSKHDKEKFSRSINQLCQKPYEQISKVFFIAPSLLIPTAQKMYYKATWNKDAGKKIIENLLNDFTPEYATSVMSCVYDKQKEDGCTNKDLISCLKPFTIFSGNYLTLRQSINDGNATLDEKKSLLNLLNNACLVKVPINLLRVLHEVNYSKFIEQFAWRLLSNQAPFYFLDVIIDKTKKLGALADAAGKVKTLCDNIDIMNIVLQAIIKEETKLINQN